MAMAFASFLTPRFLRFLAVGVLNTGVGYALFAAMILCCESSAGWLGRPRASI